MPGTEASYYNAASLSVTPSGRYLWAITRGSRNANPARNSQLSCFLLAEDGSIVKRMFVMATMVSTAGTNAVTPAPWNEEYAVVAESGSGSIVVMRLASPKTGEHGVEYAGAEQVARLTISDKQCCANAVWYS